MLGLCMSHLRLARAAPLQSSCPLLLPTYGHKPQENTAHTCGMIASPLWHHTEIRMNGGVTLLVFVLKEMK